ncbi:MAG: outer membrane protein transport protein [Synergistes sp.]|nr:outer membrane protein transport protein [Synergistes sp.]
MNKKRIFAAFLAALLAVTAPAAAFAEGFGVYEWSASGTAMGDNYMFGENDPSVLAYNPAQITKLDGAYLSLGAAFFNPASSYSFTKNGPLNRSARGQQGEWDNQYSPATAPYLFYAQKAGKNSWFGIGLFSRFGNQIEYDADWPGRYDTIYSGIEGYSIQPTYAFKINDKFSAAVGLDICMISLNMKKAMPVILDNTNPLATYIGDINSDVDGTSTAVGWLVSLMYDFSPKTSVAMVYRSRISQKMDADAKFGGTLAGIGPYHLDTRAHGEVTLPDSFSFGIGHKFNDRTRIEFNALWTNWSTYDRLDLTFDDKILGTIGESKSAKDWSGSWRLGLGLEHKLNDKWSLLCGYLYDESPVPDNRMDFTVPTGDRHRGSIGFKYRPTQNIEVAFAYTAIWAGNRHVSSQYSGIDFDSCHIHSALTQVLSLGVNFKLK